MKWITVNSQDLSMNVTSFPEARFLFQRQMINPSVIEIEFREIMQINIKPVEKDQGVDILSTHLYLQDGVLILQRTGKYSGFHLLSGNKPIKKFVEHSACVKFYTEH